MTYITYEKRILSYFLDFAIAFTISAIFTFVYNFTLDIPITKYVHSILVLTSIIYFVLSVFFLSITKGKTLGRMMTSLKLVDVDDSQLKFFQIVIRSLLECFIGFGVINLIYQVLYRSKDSFFDRATHTKIKI